MRSRTLNPVLHRDPSEIRLGLALGSGSSRGWSHIGVIRALEERGVRPTVIAGASIGSLVGGAYASGQLGELENWALSLSRMDVLRLLDTTFARGGGVMSGERLFAALDEVLENPTIESLELPYGAVATELDTGVEVWLRSGPLLDAVRASSGMPGLFTPVWYEGRWLIDGGVVNPVPVNLCRALGADYVIAVSLNKHRRAYSRAARAASLREEPAGGGDAGENRLADSAAAEGAAPEPADGGPSTGGDGSDDDPSGSSRWPRLERISGLVEGLVESWRGGEERRPEPGVFDVVGSSISIMQDRITRSRMVGDPPEILLEPDLSHFELMDFHRAEEAVEIGRSVVERAADPIEDLKAILRL